MEIIKNPEISILYDGAVNIAIGKSRNDVKWKNGEVLWSEFVKRIQNTTYTHEMYNTYMSAAKSRQDEIKDIGGYVGGFINNGRRLNGNIVNRHIVTLDIDHGSIDIWDDLCMLYGCAAAMHTTHKHSSASPRLRLIIPLSRPVFCDEYEAIARRVAGDLGINKFDDTTFQANRLMYWPSTSKDGEYIFWHYDGIWLDADDILDSYFNWKDSSSWPTSERVDSNVKREIKKQGDPLEKPGLIGAFCRAYTIQEAIDNFLPDVYESCASVNRYTYKEGSTAAGLVIYEDKFAYSHHGTDPVSGKLCNAFDLVRIHKYGLKDEDAKDNTPANKLPSYTAMLDFISKIPEVRQCVAVEKIEEAKSDFLDVEVEDEADDSWKSKLDIDRKGNILPTINNIILINENDPMLKNKFALNDFEHRALVKGDLPWRKFDPEKINFNNLDDAGMRFYLENTYGITAVKKIEDGVNLAFARNAFHPIRVYLLNQKWDGVERLDYLLVDYLGADKNPYVVAVTRKAFVAAVARVFNPGIKFDYVLTLIGMQGIGKSTFFKKVGGTWFSDSFTTVIGKEAYEQLQGVWLVEMGELAGLKKAELEAVKHFISKQEDIFRPPYGHRTERYPRQCVFFATTNKADFLKDPTGNRRFWPVDLYVHEPTKSIFKDLDEYTINQIWAEAYHRFKQGETLFLPPEIEAMANDQQDSHSEENSKIGLIQEYLDMELPSNWYDLSVTDRRCFIQRGNDEFILEPAVSSETIKRVKVCIPEIWCELFEGSKKDLDKFKAAELRDAMRKVDAWEEHDLRKNKGRLKFGIYGSQKAYVRRNTEVTQ